MSRTHRRAVARRRETTRGRESISAAQRTNPAPPAHVGENGADESVCKPDPVPGHLTVLRSATIHLGLPSPAGSSGPPAGSGGQPSNACAAVHVRPLDLAPGGVYRATPVTRGAGGLLHHRFTLTPGPEAGGGLFSVALSRGLPRVAVDNHPALWSPDFPRQDPEVPPRPPDRLVRNDEDTHAATAARTTSASSARLGPSDSGAPTGRATRLAGRALPGPAGLGGGVLAAHVPQNVLNGGASGPAGRA